MNLGKLVLGETGPLPCTPLGIIELLKRYDVPIAGAAVTVVGRGVTVGRPLGLLLTRRSENATVTLCHTGTKDLAAEVRRADIVVAAAGNPALITRTWSGRAPRCWTSASPAPTRAWSATSTRTSAKKAGFLAPMPGGVGPMTVAMLLTNTVAAAERSLAK